MRGERPGAEGGAWLPATDPGSVGIQVKLPCLGGGIGSSATECGYSAGYALHGPLAVVQWVLLVGCVAAAAGTLVARARLCSAADSATHDEFYAGAVRHLLSTADDCSMDDSASALSLSDPGDELPVAFVPVPVSPVSTQRRFLRGNSSMDDMSVDSHQSSPGSNSLS